MERFLRADAPMVVSVYAPITFPTAGVLLFKQRANGKRHTSLSDFTFKRVCNEPIVH